MLTIERVFEGNKRKLVTDPAASLNEAALGAFEAHLTERLAEVFTAARGKAITIRLFEPPLGSFVPCPLELAREMGECG